MKLSKKIFAIALPALVGTAFAAQYNFERKAPEKVSLQQTHQPSLRHQQAVEEAPYRFDDEAESVQLLSAFPKNETQFNMMTIVDVEGDGNGTNNQWVHATTTNANYDDISAMMIYPSSYSGTLSNLDDWAFIPVDVTADAADMVLSVDTKTQYSFSSSNYPFEVKFGTAPTPDAMTTSVISVDNYKGKAWVTNKGEFSVTGKGQYYVGIHATFGKDQGRLWLGNVNLTMTPKESGSTIGPDGEILNIHPTEDEFNQCTVIDANNDGASIFYNVCYDSQGRELDWPICYTNDKTSNNADDWLITPAITLPSVDNVYTISLEAYCVAWYKTEAFEVAIGKTPDVAGMTKILINEPGITNTSYQPFSTRFGVSEAGQYYVGIHVKSSKSSGWKIAMRNLQVYMLEDSSLVPESASNVTATPNPKGLLNATISFTLPEYYLNGTAIPADETISAVVTSTEAEVEVSGKPGETLSTEIAAPKGISTITVLTKNANGDGASTSKNVRCGLDEPVAPNVSSTISDDNMSLIMTWDPVTTGANGGIVDPDGVTYSVYQYVTTDSSSGWSLVKSGIKGTSYTFTTTDTDLTLYEFIVSAFNSEGDSDGDYCCYASGVLGTPDTLPIEETFPDGGFSYSGICIDYPTEDYYASWALDDPSLLADDCANDSGYALMCMNQYDGDAKARLSLTKFSTVGHNHVRLVISSFVFEGMPTVDVFVEDNLGVKTELGTISGANGYGWKKINFDLPEELSNRTNLKVVLEMTISDNYTFFAMDGYRLYERTANDLAISSINFPSYIKLGDEGTATVKVESLGYNDATLPALTAKIYNGNRLVDETPLVTEDGSQEVTLSEGDLVALSGSFSFDNADLLGKYLTLVVTIPTEDNNASNNSSSVAFKIGMSGTPVVNDLTAKENASGDAIDLNWTAPFANGYVDQFEGYTSFQLSGVIGPWKNIDFDGQSTYTFDAIEIPNATTAKAFMVINDFEMGYDGALDMPSGNQCLAVFSAQEADSDDWLVSPEIAGGSTVSFYACPLSSQYNESFEIMYSTTDDDADSFKALQTEKTGDVEWVLYTAQLPDDAKYFAIHYISNDQFGLLIDDITYEPVNPDVVVDGYEVYRDSAKVATIGALEAYSDTAVEVGNSYKYNVAATGTYSGIQLTFPMSNTASCRLTGVDGVSAIKSVFAGKGEISVLGYAGSNVRIYNTAGVAVVNQIAVDNNVKFPLESGNYIVVVGTRTSKLFVR
jgi:hypothetical protein